MKAYHFCLWISDAAAYYQLRQNEPELTVITLSTHVAAYCWYREIPVHYIFDNKTNPNDFASNMSSQLARQGVLPIRLAKIASQ